MLRNDHHFDEAFDDDVGGIPWVTLVEDALASAVATLDGALGELRQGGFIELSEELRSLEDPGQAVDIHPAP